MIQKRLTPSVVILTALSVEFQAVNKHLTPDGNTVAHSTVYQIGTFACSGCLWKVKLGEIGASNTMAAIKTTQAIEHFQPDVVLFVGVAGGLKDVQIGDVVAARKIYAYESGKDSITFLPHPENGYATPRMESWARFVSDQSSWLKRIQKQAASASRPTPHAFVKAIAAGEKVVNALSSPTVQLLQKQYSDTLAIEMEGYGFLRAAYHSPGIDALVIRGISDLLEGKSEADAANMQELASNHASAFAFELLSQLGTDQEFLNLYRTRQLHTQSRSTSQKRPRSRKQPTTTYHIQNSGQMTLGPHSQIINHPQSE